MIQRLSIIISGDGKNMGKQVLSCTAGGSKNQYNQIGGQLTISVKNEDMSVH